MLFRSVNLERKAPWLTFIKSLIGAFIGFSLAMAAFLIRPDQLGDRLFLTAASVFAVIGNQIVLDSYLPFVTIIVTTFSQVLSSHLVRANSPTLAQRLDTGAGLATFTLYAGSVSWLLQTAITAA